MRNVGLYTFMIPVGFRIAANFLTGKYIGLNRVDLAKRISNYCVNGAYMWSILSILIVWCFQQGIHDFYTHNDTIKGIMREAWPVFAVFVFFDCMQAVINGLISGLNLVAKAKGITMISYWFFGIPLSCFMMFYMDKGIEGLWYGPTLAVCINYFYYMHIVYNANW